MIFWITSLDGTISFRVQADHASHALDLLSRSMNYPSFMEMCSDLNFDRRSFEVHELRDERREHPQHDYAAQHRQEREGLLANAFRFMRRNG